MSYIETLNLQKRGDIKCNNLCYKIPLVTKNFNIQSITIDVVINEQSASNYNN